MFTLSLHSDMVGKNKEIYLLVSVSVAWQPVRNDWCDLHVAPPIYTVANRAHGKKHFAQRWKQALFLFRYD